MDAKKTQKNAFDEPVISWTAPEYIKYERGKIWVVLAVLFITLMVIGALIKGSWTTAVVFIALALVYFLAHKHEPRQLEMVISELGIKIGEKIYPYSDIKTFWMHYHPPFEKTLRFRTMGKMFKDVVIQLDGQDPVSVRTYLSRHLPEWEGKDEDLTDILARILKL